MGRTTDKHEFLRSIVGIGRGKDIHGKLFQLSKNKIISALTQSGERIYPFSNADIDKHCQGIIHLYYSSSFTKQNARVLWAIDNDLKQAKIDELEGDITSFDLWETEALPKLFPGIECHRSRGGIGSHAHFWVMPGSENSNLSIFAKNAMARSLSDRLEKALEQYRVNKGYNFSQVEVKGTNTIVNYQKSDVKLGHLCLLPRTDDHIEYCRSRAPIYTFDQIKSVIERLEAYNNTIASSEEKTVIRPVLKIEKTTSWKPKIVTVDYELGEAFCQYLGKEVRSLDGRYICSSKDFAILIAIVNALENSDIKKYGHVKHMAFVRIEKMWKAMYESGDIDVPYEDRRVTAMRNALSESGYINWINNKFAKGTATVWGLCNELFLLVTGERQEDTCIGKGQALRPVFDSTVSENAIFRRNEILAEEICQYFDLAA